MREFKQRSRKRCKLSNMFDEELENADSSESNDDAVEEIINNLFSKQFSISNNEHYSLPKPERLYRKDLWQIEELQLIKTELNNTKSKLNNYNLDEWHKHTSNRNKAGEVCWWVRRTIKPEFVTQAWLKFHEIANTFPLVPLEIIDNLGKFTSIHLCEAPGAFITSLNHYLKTNVPSVEWDWLASTLNPYYEGNPLSRMISDDRILSHTLEHWHFGVDNTGNIMSLRNLDAFVEESKKKANVLLVTADGSVNCLDSPGEQEIMVSHLHFCEAVTALHLLNAGGNFLLKIFTIFECQSICLLYLLSCLFESVALTKPATSKEGNSETYVVCLRYKGFDNVKPYINIIRNRFEQSDLMAMICREDIPDSFINTIINCATFFKDLQCDVILNNISTFQMDHDFLIKKIRRTVAQRYVKRCKLKSLESSEMEIVGKMVLQNTAMDFDREFHYESYNDRQKYLTPAERLSQLSKMLPDVSFLEYHYKFKLALNPTEKPEICLGKPYDRVYTSKFCEASALNVLNDIYDIRTRSTVKSEDADLHLPLKEKRHPFLSNLPKNTKYVNFDFMTVQNYHTAIMVYEKLKTLEKDEDHLTLVGYSLLPQFHVGLLYYLTRIFDELVLSFNPDVGVTVNLKYYNANPTILTYLEEIVDATKLAHSEGIMVLSIVPIGKLCESCLYYKLRKMNLWNIKYCAEEILDISKPVLQ